MKNFVYIAPESIFEISMPSWFFGIFSYLVRSKQINIKSIKNKSSIKRIS